MAVQEDLENSESSRKKEIWVSIIGQLAYQ